MSVKPILFNTEEVCATLDGRKTVTRRVMKPQPIVTENRTVWNGYEANLFKGTQDGFGNLLLARLIADGKSPYRPGDILYVRETWFQFKHGSYAYRADSDEVSEMMREDLDYKWRPSIHMPREAARIFLRVTDVRVERLQEITLTDIWDEGMLWLEEGTERGVKAMFGRFIWDSTVKPADRERYGWAANPWVWVIEFERCEKPEGN